MDVDRQRFGERRKAKCFTDSSLALPPKTNSKLYTGCHNLQICVHRKAQGQKKRAVGIYMVRTVIGQDDGEQLEGQPS